MGLDEAHVLIACLMNRQAVGQDTPIGASS